MPKVVANALDFVVLVVWLQIAKIGRLLMFVRCLRSLIDAQTVKVRVGVIIRLVICNVKQMKGMKKVAVRIWMLISWGMRLILI